MSDIDTVEATPAYKYIKKYIDDTFPMKTEAWRIGNAHKWLGLMRTIKFQKWVEEQLTIINKDGGA